jgi:hypothetical protein
MAPPDAPLSPAALDQIRAVVREEVLGARGHIQIGTHELMWLVINLVGAIAERLTGERVVVMVRDAQGDDLHFEPQRRDVTWLKPGEDAAPYDPPAERPPSRLAPLRPPGGTPSRPGPA